jgi:UDP-glucose 4-epimerase
MLTVVVTGASGLLGKYVVKKLQQDGHNVIATSRKIRTGFMKVDSYAQCPNGDVAIHLAEEPDRGLVNQKDEAYLDASKYVMKSLANQFRENLIYMSSGTVYGDQGGVPFTTEAETFATDNYSKLKLYNESTALENGATVLRLANVYGYGMNKNNVLSDIIKQLSLNDAVEVRNEFPIRDYVYVEDVAKACSLLLKSLVGGIFNIGSGEGVSIRNLTEIILSIKGQHNRRIHSLAAENIFSCNVLDISKAKIIFGYLPTKSITENISEMLNEMDN